MAQGEAVPPFGAVERSHPPFFPKASGLILGVKDPKDSGRDGLKLLRYKIAEMALGGNLSLFV